MFAFQSLNVIIEASWLSLGSKCKYAKMYTQRRVANNQIMWMRSCYTRVKNGSSFPAFRFAGSGSSEARPWLMTPTISLSLRLEECGKGYLRWKVRRIGKESAPSRAIMLAIPRYLYVPYFLCRVGLSYSRCRRFNEGAQSQAHWVKFSPGSDSLSCSLITQRLIRGIY